MSTLKIKRENGKIFCPLADSWHIETPEEKVRQEYIKILVENYGYSLDQMAQEIKVNNSQRGQGKARADIVIWKSKQDKIESKAAFIVVECKAENVRIREEDYYQGYNYASWAGASFFVTTNEKETKYFNVDKDYLPKELVEVVAIPTAEEALNDKKVKDILSKTKTFTRDDFTKILRTCHNIADNGFAMLKKQLAELLYSTNPIEKRWDVFLKSIKGMGPATISELLTYANPQEYVIFNKTTILCYGYLDIPDMPKYNYQYTGKKYAEVCAIAKKIAAELKKAGADDYDLLAVDYFMWDEILPLAEKKSPVSPATPEVKKPVTVKDSKSLHDEIKEKLVAIGELLGFDSRSEVKITTGAVVDAVWEAKIGNMGKAIYVFEVQSKGSIDSLILNLKKAQSNAAVQAVVAVADEEQLAKIIRESAGVIDEKSLRTWDSEDVLAVYDSLVRAHESINKLALVPESF